MKIDYERLREDLMDYYGHATPFFNVAMASVIQVEEADNDELLNIIDGTDLDINDYIDVKVKKK